MLKGGIYITIAVFLFIGFLYMFVIDVDISDLITNSQFKDSKKNHHINDYLITDDFNLKTFTHKITSSCLNDDKACQILEIYKYVRSSFIIDNVTNDVSAPNPLNAFKNRQGTYLDITLLYSSLLLNSGISTYIKKDGSKYYSYACGINNFDMYSAIKADLHSNPLTHKELTLRNGQVWAFDLSRENNDNLIIDVEFFSKYPVDMVLFPNKQEMSAHLKGHYGRNNADCSLFNVTEANISCQAPQKTGIIIFKSLSDDNKFKAVIYKGGILAGDIKSEKSRQGSNCIKIDVNSRGDFIYPGIIY